MKWTRCTTRATRNREEDISQIYRSGNRTKATRLKSRPFRNEENEKTTSRGARNRGKRSGRVTRIPTVTPWPARVFQFAQPLPSTPPPTASPASPAPLAFHWPIIDPFANFQMLRRKQTRRQRDGNAHESESAGISGGVSAPPTGQCISQTSDLHQIDPLSQQDQLYARSVYSSPLFGPAVSARAARRWLVAQARLTPNGTICSATDPFYHETAKDDWCGSGLPRSISSLVSIRARVSERAS